MTMNNAAAPELREIRDRILEMRDIEIESIDGFEAGNPVDRTERDIDLLDTSLDENGYAMPIMVRAKGDGRFETLDGHGRIDRIRTNYPGTTSIKALVLDVATVAEGRKLILGLRNSAAWSMADLDAWVGEALEEGELDVDEVMRLSGLTAVDLDSLAAAGQRKLDELQDEADKIAAGPGSSAGTSPTPTMVVEVDIQDELPRKAITQVGDIWTLGSSRLVCGNSTMKKVLQQACAGADADLLWTDPPWNVALDAGNKPTGRSSTRKTNTTIMNDALGKDYHVFATAFATAFAQACKPGVPIYVAMSCDEWGLIHDTLKRVGFHWSSTIIWAKNSLILSRKDFHPQYEPIWYGWREGAPRKCAPSERTVSDLWPFERPRKSDLHPSMKPIALVARSINSSSKPGDLVLDPFGGSGTTLLAAEQMGRRAALVELDPAYCDVIVQRWQSLTGRKATRNHG